MVDNLQTAHAATAAKIWNITGPVHKQVLNGIIRKFIETKNAKLERNDLEDAINTMWHTMKIPWIIKANQLLAQKIKPTWVTEDQSNAINKEITDVIFNNGLMTDARLNVLVSKLASSNNTLIMYGSDAKCSNGGRINGVYTKRYYRNPALSQICYSCAGTNELLCDGIVNTTINDVETIEKCPANTYIKNISLYGDNNGESIYGASFKCSDNTEKKVESTGGIPFNINSCSDGYSSKIAKAGSESIDFYFNRIAMGCYDEVLNYKSLYEAKIEDLKKYTEEHLTKNDEVDRLREVETKYGETKYKALDSRIKELEKDAVIAEGKLQEAKQQIATEAAKATRLLNETKDKLQAALLAQVSAESAAGTTKISLQKRIDELEATVKAGTEAVAKLTLVQKSLDETLAKNKTVEEDASKKMYMIYALIFLLFVVIVYPATRGSDKPTNTPSIINELK